MRTRPLTIGTRRHQHRATIAALAAGTLVLAGCSATGTTDAGGKRPAAVSAAPAGPKLIASDDPAELALNASATWFSQAAFAVVADPADAAAVARGASMAAAAGVPALLAEPEPVGDSPLDAELERLGADGIVTVGAVDPAVFADRLAVAPAPTQPGELGRLLGVTVEVVDPDPAAPVRQVAALEGGQVLAAPENAPTGQGRGELPASKAAERTEASAVVTTADPSRLAAIGTARAAGATAVVTDGIAGATSQNVEQLRGRTSIVGLGTSFGDDASFAWQALTASGGVELPGGGQQVFGDKRYIALYGSPITPSLGLLGEQGTAETIARAQKTAAPYAALTDDRIVPALEIIVTVASSSAGPDGNYSTEFDIAEFRPLIEAAREAGQYVVLDFQPGRTDFVTQIKKYEELLLQPHVGVALDPEWRLTPGQVHLTQIGSVGVDEVNRVTDYLADFVATNRLPQKLVILHQFQVRMITDRSKLDTSRPEVAVLIHADGQGGQPAKQDTWRVLHQDAPEGIAWGWKNFIDEDLPMLTPEQTYRQVDPIPEFVSYQ